MTKINKIGIFGGTFNPIHNAHITIANAFTNELNLDVCYFVPAWLSPFKTVENNETLISADHRIEMIKLAISERKEFKIDTFEINKKGVSYTINTVNNFKRNFPDAQLFLLAGSDQLNNFKRWKDYLEIIKCVRLCIAERPGYEIDLKIISDLIYENKTPYFINSKIMDISATEIREKILNHQPIDMLVNKKVEMYLTSHKIYK